MSKKANQEVGQELAAQVVDALDRSLEQAEFAFANQVELQLDLSERLLAALNDLSVLAPKASTGFTNIITCLAIKIARPNVDIRFHQVQIQTKTDRPAGFNFRGVSEKIIYPWLNAHAFEGAKSGWQTRTFERPKPYVLAYDENIGEIKTPFLTVFDEIEEYNASLKYYLRLLSEPGLVFPIYVNLLQTDKTIAHEHREIWNKLTTQE